MTHLSALPAFTVALGALLLAAPAVAVAWQGPAQTTPARQTSSTALAVLTPPPATGSPLSISAPANPQVVQLRGVVRLPDGRPCAGASVYPTGAPRQLVVTDAQGNFTLPVPAGAATALRVEFFGLGSSRVEVPAPTSEPLHITLGK